MMRLARLLAAIFLGLALVASPSLGSVSVFGFKIPVKTGSPTTGTISYDGNSGKQAPGVATFSFTSGTLGSAASANRRVIVQASFFFSGTVTPTVSTICGNSATTVTASTNANTANQVIAIADCPSGTTATITGGISGGGGNISNFLLGIYSAELASTTADHTANSVASPSPLSVVASINGVAVSGSYSNTSATSITLSGTQTQNYNGQLLGSTSMGAGADQTLTGGGTSTATYTYVGGSQHGAAAASFH